MFPSFVGQVFNENDKCIPNTLVNDLRYLYH